ncbi:MAG: NADPH:quinone oxidoreductase family protein [Pikeienuella sp.]
MKAMLVHELGGALQLDQSPRPEPGPGQALIRVRACGVNFADTLMVQGKYQEKHDLPFAPGMEIAGVVEQVGESVSLPLGSRVAALCGHGGFAEYALAPASSCVPIPDKMPDTDAAAFLVAYGTSHVALDYRVNLKPGENLLVLGAAGGVGLTAVEIGKLMGANVIACARGQKKLEFAARAGADHLIDSSADDIREKVKSLGGADVVYDPVGGDQFKAAMRACNPEARLLPLGFASGDVPQIPANILLVKNLTVHGFYWGAYAHIKPAVLANSLTQLFTWYVEGRLQPHISNIIPLAEANEALRLLKSREATGKVVIEVE